MNADRTRDDEQRMLDVLRGNVGFDDPRTWLEYGLAHSFRRVVASEVLRCPDCQGRSGIPIGQFVYYSTLIKLVPCSQCGLIWTTARLSEEVIAAHFESAYKDEQYFDEQRAPIFEDLARHISVVAESGARVLDVGGAKGHLMATLVSLRPDLQVTVHDLSVGATRHAAEKYRFRTLCGNLDVLEAETVPYDVVVLSDVMYYEAEISRLWAVLNKLVAARGALVIRVPNKLAYIRLTQRFLRWTRSKRSRELSAHVEGFNPEHLFILTPGYLRSRLGRSGFTEIQALPSPPLRTGRRFHDVLSSILFEANRFVSTGLRGRLIATPAMLFIARRAAFDHQHGSR